MSRLPDDLRQHRALRDAAWALVRQDGDYLRAALERRSVARRMADRALVLARDAASGAGLMARENKGLVWGALAAGTLWILRKPLLARITDREKQSDTEENQLPPANNPDHTQGHDTE